MPFQIIRNDITKVKVDAIVNTANPNVAVGAGVDRAIYAAAGKEQLLKEREKIGRLPPGNVGVTSAGDLDAKYIIHVSGPVWIDGSGNEAEVLKICYEKALAEADIRKCKSIAFPLLATGTYGFPKELGIQIAVDAFTAFLEEHDMEITLVVFGDETVRISGELALEVASYIDDEYEESALEEEYSYDADYRSAERPYESESLLSHIGSRLHRRGHDYADEYVKAPKLKSKAGSKSKAERKSLDDMLKDIYKDSFEKHLQKLINKKGLKNSQVYSTANISKQYFSKLLKGQVKPSKEKMLALAIGLRLNLYEAIDFLGVAGYALSPVSQTDAVVKYFIEHEDYNVLKIDIVLFDYGLDPLTNKNLQGSPEQWY